MSDRQGHLRQYRVRAGPAPGSARLCGLALALAGGILLAACGSDERTFSAEQFVEAANRHGARLELGLPLSTSDTGDELYALELRFADVPLREQALPRNGGESEQEHAGGALRVSESAEEAEAEHSRCEAAVTLLCYRAANVVLILEQGVDSKDLRALESAIRAMESEG
jgi:hypothetical protein